MEIIVRDLRKKDKFQVDDKYLNGYAKFCGANATLVYLCLCRHADYYTQQCFPSVETMAEKLGISVSSVKRGLNDLVDWHIIVKERTRHPENAKWVNNSYTLLDKSVWKPIPQVNESRGATAQIDPEPQLKNDQSHSSVGAGKESHRRSHIEGDAEHSSAQVPVSHETPERGVKPLSIRSFFNRPKPDDSAIPLGLEDFVLLCRSSEHRNVRLIGEYADERKFTFHTRGQWREFGNRNLRVSKRLAPYTDRQLSDAIKRVKKEATRDFGGFKWGMETLEKYLEEAAAKK